MALPLVVGQGLDFGLVCKQVQSFRFRMAVQPEPKPSGIWSFSEDRLADLGALIVFRHWLRGLLKDQAGAKEVQREPQASAGAADEPRYGRLFF